MLSDGNRSNREKLNSFVPRWRGSATGLRFPSPLTLWLGELKSSTTKYIAGMNTSGRDWVSLDIPDSSLTLYTRFCWGPTKKTWDLWGGGNRANGSGVTHLIHRYQSTVADRFTAQVKICDTTGAVWQMWSLIPVKVESVPPPPRSPSETPPSYDGRSTGQSSTHTQHAESERDDFGTVVTEVTTTIITTRKKYRVDDA